MFIYSSSKPVFPHQIVIDFGEDEMIKNYKVFLKMESFKMTLIIKFLTASCIDYNQNAANIS